MEQPQIENTNPENINPIPLTKSGQPDKRYKLPTRKPETELEKSLEPKPNRIDVPKAFQLRYKNNLTFQQIADIFKVSPQAVQDRLAKFTKIIPDISEIEAYRVNKAEIMEAIQFKQVEALIEDDRLKKASINNIAYSVQVLGNEIRLARNEPTEHIAIQHAIIAQIKAESVSSKGDAVNRV